jgi:hypothetical protein
MSRTTQGGYAPAYAMPSSRTGPPVSASIPAYGGDPRRDMMGAYPPAGYSESRRHGR